MSVILTIVLPLIMLIGFSVMLGMWNSPCHPEGRKAYASLTRIDNILAVTLVLWWVGYSLYQGALAIATPGQLLASVATCIWLATSYAEFRISQRKLTIIPLATVILLIATALSAGLHIDQELPQDLVNPRAAVHIALSLAGMTMLFGSGVYGVGEMILHRQIKNRSFGQWFHDMPPMSDLNRLRRISLTTGWILITISIALALGTLQLMLETREVSVMHLFPMLILWTIITALWAADRFHWLPQQKMAVASLAMSVIMLLLLIVSVIGFFTVAFA